MGERRVRSAETARSIRRRLTGISIFFVVVVVSLGLLAAWGASTTIVMRAGIAFVAGGFIAGIGTPLLRRVAGRDDASQGNKARRGISVALTWRGVPLIVGILVGICLGGGITLQIAVATLAAACLATLYIRDSAKHSTSRLHTVAQLVCAAFIVGVSVRFHINGQALDAVMTCAWILVITRSVGGIDTMAGLTVGLMVPTGASLFALATFSGQDDIARVGAALAGASAGCFWHNFRRTRAFTGRAGTVFVGFLLAAAILEVEPVLGPPADSAVPVLMLGLPLLDLLVVTVGRLRRGLALTVERTDHLAHRLVLRGLSPATTLAVLIAAQTVLSLLAFLAGRGISTTLCLTAAAVLLAALFLTASRGRTYAEGAVAIPNRVRWGLAGVIVAGVILSVPSLMALLAIRSTTESAVQHARNGLAAARGGESDDAIAEFTAAAELFSEARVRLSEPLPRLGLLVPVVAPNIHAAQTLSTVGAELSRSGERLARTLGKNGIGIEGGTVAIEDLRDTARAVQQSARVMRSAAARVRIAGEAYLVPPMRHAVGELDEMLTMALGPSEIAAEAAQLAPRLLGDGGTRRYFLAIQNNAELRGTGGFIGSFGELVAENGTIRLDRIGRIGELTFPRIHEGEPPFPVPEEVARRYSRYGLDWRHVNVSPDFPTVGGIISDLYPRSGGQPVDGVIAVDAHALAAFLSFVGPVQVPDWPELITSANVVRITTHDSALEDRNRAEFLAEVTRATWEKLSSVDLPSTSTLLSALGEAARGGHLMLYFTRADEQELARKAGIAGDVAPLQSDSLMVVTNNAAGNKIDYYLSRRVRYEVHLSPEGDLARVEARVEVTMRNSAPARGLSVAIIGPAGPRFPRGENVSVLTVHTPQRLVGGSVNGQVAELRSDRELGRLAHEDPFFRVPAGSDRSLELRLAGKVALRPGGWYQLDLLRQPTLWNDEVEVVIHVRPGWEIVDAVGLTHDGARFATTSVELDRGRTVGLRLEPTGLERFVHRLRWPASGHSNAWTRKDQTWDNAALAR